MHVKVNTTCFIVRVAWTVSCTRSVDAPSQISADGSDVLCAVVVFSWKHCKFAHNCALNFMPFYLWKNLTKFNLDNF